jgi:hypothetical protein
MNSEPQMLLLLHVSLVHNLSEYLIHTNPKVLACIFFVAFSSYDFGKWNFTLLSDIIIIIIIIIIIECVNNIVIIECIIIIIVFVIFLYILSYYIKPEILAGTTHIIRNAVKYRHFEVASYKHCLVMHMYYKDCSKNLVTFYVRSEVFTAVTMNNAICLDVTLCVSRKIWRFGGT